MAVIPKDKYTIDSVAGTITLLVPFDALTIASINKIMDLDVNSTIYDFEQKRTGVTLISGVISWTETIGNMTNDDELRIEIDELSGATSISAYNETTNSINMVEQAPLDQQALDNRLLDGVTVAQTSTEVTVLDKKRLTFFLNVADGTTGGAITIQGVNDDGDAVDVAFYEIGDVSSTKIASKVCTSTVGNYCFSLPENLAFKKVTVTLGSYTNGTFTMDVFGGAL